MASEAWALMMEWVLLGTCTMINLLERKTSQAEKVVSISPRKDQTLLL